MLKTKRLFWSDCSLLLLLLVAPNAFAQDPNLRATLSGGGSFLKGERTFVIGGDGFRSKFVSGGKFGFRGTADWDDHWALEGAYSYGTNNLRIIELGPPQRERDFGVRVHQFAGNVLYFLNGPKAKIRPFATAGVGLTRYSPTSHAKTFAATVQFVDAPAAMSASNKLSGNFGGGLEAKAGNHLGARFDFRDYVTKIPRFGDPQAPAAPGADFFPVSGGVHDLEASVGLVFYLKP